MLGGQARLLAVCADGGHMYRLASDRGDRRGRAENLASSFTVRAVYLKHREQ
jgi:hypothetical protein